MNKSQKVVDKIKEYTINPLAVAAGKRIEKKHFSKVPIIIGACPRSGTTILLSILDAHPNIFGIPNQTYAFDRWEEYENAKTKGKKYRLLRIDRLYREFVKNKIPPTALRWLEKTPGHIRSFNKILSYYDDKVKLIHVIRDGRDVVTSKHPKHSPHKYWVSPSRWVREVNVGLDLEGHPSVINVRYEDLITDFENTITKIYKFLDEQPPDSLTSWKEETNIRKSKHWAAPVQDLYSDAIARWKKPEHKKRLDEFMSNEQAVELLKKLDYL